MILLFWGKAKAPAPPVTTKLADRFKIATPVRPTPKPPKDVPPEAPGLVVAAPPQPVKPEVAPWVAPTFEPPEPWVPEPEPISVQPDVIAVTPVAIPEVDDRADVEAFLKAEAERRAMEAEADDEEAIVMLLHLW